MERLIEVFGYFTSYQLGIGLCGCKQRRSGDYTIFLKLRISHAISKKLSSLEVCINIMIIKLIYSV